MHVKQHYGQLQKRHASSANSW